MEQNGDVSPMQRSVHLDESPESDARTSKNVKDYGESINAVSIKLIYDLNEIDG